MSWSIEEHIGDCRPFPAQVVVYKGETGECLAYVSGEVADRLRAENTKLRELCADLYFMRDKFNSRRATMIEVRMHELGVEVDE